LQVLFDFVGVAGNDGIEAGGLGFEVQIAQIMKHVESCVAKFDDHRGREFVCPWSGVHIAAHGENRGNGAEAGEDPRFADVASVENKVNAAQRVFGFRSKPAVGIGNYANFHSQIPFWGLTIRELFR